MAGDRIHVLYAATYRGAICCCSPTCQIVKLAGVAATKATGISLPIALAAGSFVTVATLVDLPLKGVKRVSFDYRLDASISHQAYFNFFNSNGIFLGSSLTGVTTAQQGAKQTDVLNKSKVTLTINNQDAAARNVTVLEILLWYA
ncbi:hypothetical protein YDYSY3_35680 [Paenibacillus chitinolyticus]|nr:hypothetical protein YDYSY3_35680 [Paenibacillus chitinolyticus]